MSILAANVILFQPSGDGSTPLAVEFPDGFKIEAGITPDVNVARASYVEVGKLNGNFNQTGSLQFFYSSTPANGGSPDVTIQNVAIVEAIPKEIGQPISQSADGANSGEVIPIEWEIHFADFRMQFVAPRGGRLRWGVVNPSDAQPIDTADQGEGDGDGTGDGDGGDDPGGTGQTPLQMSDLIQHCLDAMGLTSVSVDQSVNGIDAPLDLQWHGSHPSTELQKLLDLCRMVFCPHLDGTVTLEFMGQGNSPNIPGGRTIATIDCGQLDQRGTTVIFTSSPTPVMVTETIAGPSDDTWEFVIQDTDRQWKALSDNPDILLGNDPAQLIQTQFAALFALAAVDQTDGFQYAQSVASQLYFCIRLNEENYPPPLVPILQQRLEKDGTVGRPLLVGKVAMQPPNGGAPYNSTAFADCNAHLKANDTILISDVRLGKMSGTSSSPAGYDTQFTPLVNGDLNVRFTHEKLDDNNQPVYYEVGFQRDADSGAVTQMADSDVSDALDNPDANTVIINRPEWQLLNVDGNDVNKTTGIGQGDTGLDQKASALADQYLADSTTHATEVHGVGFIGGNDIGGVISKIVFHQHEVKTVFYCDHWWRPATAHFKGWQQRHQTNQRSDEAYPRQTTQQTKRSSLGMSGSTQPQMPLAPRYNDPPGAGYQTGMFSNAANAQSFYNGFFMYGTPTGPFPAGYTQGGAIYIQVLNESALLGETPCQPGEPCGGFIVGTGDFGNGPLPVLQVDHPAAGSCS